jgi:ABC-type nitrate/sulfonate/bicarbonate transport system permease component
VGGLLYRLGPPVILLIIWEGFARQGYLNPFLLPPPSQIAGALVNQLGSGELLVDVKDSLLRVMTGFVLAVLIGTPIGMGIALSRRLNLALSPLIQFLRPIPPLAWTPLAILWFGIGNGPSFLLTMIGAIFPIILSSHLGVRSISRKQLDVADCFGAGVRLKFCDVIWPAALPHILAGYRIGLGIAWMSLVGAEMIAAHSGLGYLIHVSQDLLKTDNVIAGMATIGMIGLILDFAMRFLERRLCPWFGAARV